MRQQYHSRKVGTDVLIWDINALLLKSADLPIKEIALTSILEFEETWWYQTREDVPNCRSLVDHMRLILACELQYPILLSPDGRLMDGMHRVCKAHLEGRSSILSRQLLKLPPPDYLNVNLADLPYYGT